MINIQDRVVYAKISSVNTEINTKDKAICYESPINSINIGVDPPHYLTNFTSQKKCSLLFNINYSAI